VGEANLGGGKRGGAVWGKFTVKVWSVLCDDGEVLGLEEVQVLDVEEVHPATYQSAQ